MVAFFRLMSKSLFPITRPRRDRQLGGIHTPAATPIPSRFVPDHRLSRHLSRLDKRWSGIEIIEERGDTTHYTEQAPHTRSPTHEYPR